MVTGHFGNWELAGAYVAARGIPLDAIVRGMANPLFDAYINHTREEMGMTIVHDSEAVRRTPRSLRAGRAVAFVADQGVLGLASTFVPFFGRPAKTPRGAAVFAFAFRGAGSVRRRAPAAERSVPDCRRANRGAANGRSGSRRGRDRCTFYGAPGALGAGSARAVLLAASQVEAAASGHAGGAQRSIGVKRRRCSIPSSDKDFFATIARA